MTTFGYTLSSEEQPANALVRFASMAEQHGFEFAVISDHFHPWIDQQGESPFVWSVLGGIATATSSLRIGTGVTCPIIRTHPAIIAHASATIETMMPGRFFLGVGTGEQLNEHVTGQPWPNAARRRSMLREAIDVIRALWRGEEVDYEGTYFDVRDARLYSAPQVPPPIFIAAKGTAAARMAGEIGDGLISTAPKREVVEAFEEGCATGPRFGQITVCWAEREADARRIAHKYWPNAALEGELSVELPLPRHFEQATSTFTQADIANAIVCGPSAAPYVEAIRKYEAAGFDHVYLHQVGPAQAGFLRFYRNELLPLVGAKKPRAVPKRTVVPSSGD